VSRARRWLLWAVLALGGLVLALVLLGVWLLASESGARFALARTQALLPAGSLEWRAQRGSLAQGLEFEGLRYAQDGLSIDIDRLRLRAVLGQALAARLRVERLEVEGVRVLLPSDQSEPEPAPTFEIRLPESLPSLVLPLDIEIESAVLSALRIERAPESATDAGSAPGPESAPTTAPALLFEAERIAVSALQLQGGQLRLGELQLDAPLLDLRAHGEIDSLRDWQSDLRLAGEWRAGLAAPQVFEVGIEGALQDLRLQLRLPDAPDFALDAELREGLPNPQWRIDLRAAAVPPALLALWPAGLADLQLQGEGALDRAELAGGFTVDGRAYVLEAASLRAEASTLHIDALRLLQGEGRAELQGWLQLPPTELPASFEARLDFTRFELPLAEAPPLRMDGGLSGQGAFDDAELELALHLARGELAGALRGGLRLQGGQALLQALELRTDDGRLLADGELDWSDGLRWKIEAELAELDAGLLAPDWPSRVSARLRSAGTESPTQREGEFSLEELAGELRGRSLRGSLAARWRGAPPAADAALPVAAGEAELDLRWGESALRGSASLGERLSAQLDLQPLQLDGLAEGLAGALSGRLQLTGTPQAPRLGIDFSSAELAASGAELGGVRLQGEVGLRPEAPLQLQLDSAQTRLDGRELGALALQLRGEVGAHALALRQQVDGGGLSLEFSGGWREDEQRWLGRLQQFDWRAPDRRGSGGDWSLAEAVAIELGAQRIRIEDFCLEGRQRGWGRSTASAGEASASDSATTNQANAAPTGNGAGNGRALGSLCLSAEGSGAEDLRARLQLDQVPLALPMGLVIERAGSSRPRWQGALDGALELSSNASGWRVDGRIGAPQGELRMGQGEGRALLSWSALELAVEGDPAELRLQVGARFGDEGRLQGELRALEVGAENARLEGQLSLLLDQLGVLELLSEEAVIAPVGRLSAELTIDGPLASPALQGGARLSGFGAELPALGIRPSEGRVELRLDGASAADLEFAFRSEGELRGRGRLDWSQAAEQPLRIEIEGSEVLLSDTAQVRLVVSPELQLEQRGELLRLRGRVQVPRAEVRLDRFEGSQQVSSDVVVLDPAQPERAVAAAQRIDADVRLALGEDVELEGFGLNGRVSGELRVRDRPGRTTNASGSLNVSGRYKAYGQDLDITRGRLSFAQSPLDNPGLDIRAERRIEEVTVGIRVTGTAAAPVLGLWSQPSLDQADVLSYLMLGRPVRAVRSGEGQQLNAAAAALGAGGNFIAERLGARLGFDQASVEDSAALGGSALMLGKYLSPRLYVAYGVALFGDGQVFSIKYLLTEQWDLQVEASQRETRGSVNYRLER